MEEEVDMDPEDEEALQRAIALSLQAPPSKDRIRHAAPPYVLEPPVAALSDIAGLSERLTKQAEDRALRVEQEIHELRKGAAFNARKEAALLKAKGLDHRRLREHVQSADCLHQALDILENEPSPADAAAAAELCDLYNELSVHYLMKNKAQHSQEVEDLLLRAIQLWEAWDPKHAEFGKPLFNLGRLRESEGRREEAMALYERVRAIWEDQLPPDHADLSKVYTVLGSTCLDAGDMQGAERHLLRVHEMRRSCGNPVLFARSHNNLCALYLKANEPAKALDYIQQSLVILRACFPGNDVNIGHCLISAGEVYRRLMDYSAAYQSYKEALTHLQASLPPDDSLVKQTLESVINLQSRCEGDKGGQAALMSQLANTAAGGDQLEELRLGMVGATGALLNASATSQEVADAVADLGEVVRLLRQERPGDHAAIATALGNLGVGLHTQGDNAQALVVLEEAQAEVSGLDAQAHASLLTMILTNLSVVCIRLGQKDRALDLQLQALRLQQQHLPPDHPDVAKSLCNLGVLQLEQGRHRMAAEYFEHALRIQKWCLPRHHHDTIKTVDNLCHACRQLGDHPWALKAGNLLLRLREEALGPDHVDVAEALTQLLAIHKDLKSQSSVVAPIAERRLRLMRLHYHPRYPGMGEVLVSAGEALYKDGQSVKALALLDEAVEVRRLTMPGSRLLGETVCMAGMMHGEAGDLRRGVVMLDEALAIFERQPGSRMEAGARGARRECLRMLAEAEQEEQDLERAMAASLAVADEGSPPAEDDECDPELLAQALALSLEPGAEGTSPGAPSTGPQHLPLDVASLAPGSAVASYRVERLLGEGAFGIVYAASRVGGSSADQSALLPLKILRTPPGHSDEETRVMYRIERENLGRVSCLPPSINVVRLVEAFIWVPGLPEATEVFPLHNTAHPCLVLSPLCQEGDLKHLLTDKPLSYSLSTALRWALQIAEALHALHSLARLYHGDLTPRNVLLRRSDDGLLVDAYVGDLGVAVQNRDFGLGESDVAKLSVSIAPEQLDADCEFSAQADVWSWGVILFALLSRSLDGITATHTLGVPQIHQRLLSMQDGRVELHARLAQAWHGQAVSEEVMEVLVGSLSPSESRMTLRSILLRMQAGNDT